VLWRACIGLLSLSACTAPLDADEFACTRGGPCDAAVASADAGVGDSDAGRRPDAGRPQTDAAPSDATATDTLTDGGHPDAAAPDATRPDTGVDRPDLGVAPAARPQTIAVGGGHGCVLLDDVVHCWGDGEFGKLGRGGPGDGALEQAAPVIPRLAAPRSIAAGGAYDSDMLERTLNSSIGTGARQRCGDASDLPCPDGASCIGNVCDDGSGSFAVLALEISRVVDPGSGVTICRDDPNDPGARPCHAWLTNVSATLIGQSVDAYTLELEGRLVTSAIPVRVETLGMDCTVTHDSVESGASTNDVNLSLVIEIWDPGSAGHPRLALDGDIDTVMLSNTDLAIVRDPVHGDTSDEITCGLANAGFVVPAFAELLTNGVGAALGRQMREALGWPCVTDVDCPAGTACATGRCVEPIGHRPVYRQLRYSGGHTCAIDASSSVRCWGRGDQGALGPGSPADQSNHVPAQTTQCCDAVDLSAGPAQTCAIRGTGDVWCWGSNVNQAFGASRPGSLPTPTRIPELGPAVEVETGPRATCARGVDRRLRCVGAWSGEISGLSPSRALTVGDGHACVIDDQGGASCWGANDAGQLGDMSTTSRARGAAVAGGHTFVAISAGAEHTCAISDRERVHCWGSNSDDQIGVPGAGPITAPAQVPSISDALDIAAGRNFTCVRRRLGVVSCWGDGRWGRFGDQQSSGPEIVDVLGLP